MSADTGFAWPPGDAGAGATSAPTVESHTREISVDDLSPRRREPGAFASALNEIERVWLGFGSRGVGDRLRERGWSPPPACWRCGGVVGAHECDGEGCAACRGLRVPWGRFLRLGVYDGVLRDAVLELKLTSWRRIGAELGAMMGRRLAIELDRFGVDRREVVIVPVPTTTRRRLVRGVDHTLVLARAAAGATGVRLAPHALTRAHRPRQTSLTSTDRAKNVRNTFGSRPDLMPGAGLAVVLDDVRTTGATLRAACRALGPRPAEGLWVCVAAVGEDRRSPAGGQEGPGEVGRENSSPGRTTSGLP